MVAGPGPVLGVVLTGGRSARMGTDKALVEIDGRPLAGRVADALTAGGADRVVAVGGTAALAAATGLEVWPDAHPGAGPLGAVLTALSRAPRGAVVVAPCDWARPDPTVVRAVVTVLAADTALLAAVPCVAGRAQWIHAAWRTAAHGPLAAAFASGERSLRRAAAPLGPVARVEVDPEVLADLDTPADLAALDPPPAPGPAGSLAAGSALESTGEDRVAPRPGRGAPTAPTIRRGRG